MTLLLSGTDGLSDVDGTAATPAIRGADTNTGIFFPAADTIAFSEGGVESARITSTNAWSFGSTGTNTGTSGQFLSSQGSGTNPTWASISGGDATNNIGYLNIPQNSQSTAYTLVAADAGKHILHPSTDANARTFTIPANSSVAFPIGTAVTFVNMTSQVVTIAITSDTLTLSPAGTSGSRSLAQFGSATALKIGSTQWLISGSGLT